MDTYPYPKKEAMSTWAKTIRELYPDFWIVGETWLRESSHTSYWQEHTDNYDGFNSYLPSVTDFPTYFALKDALNQDDGWVEGLSRLYYVLSQDYLYTNPDNLLIFPDNHDLTRFYTDINEDFDKFKMGIAYLLTTRGIPQIYYGTEILMTGKESQGHGFIRQDFPGGWISDSINAFNGIGLNNNQTEAQKYIKKLLNWRKETTVIHSGRFKHFIPDKGIYVYFRYNDTSTVMVVLNKNNKEVKLDATRFNEILKSYASGRDIINNRIINNLNEIYISPVSPLILELVK
jgi:glycosidase